MKLLVFKKDDGTQHKELPNGYVIAVDEPDNTTYLYRDAGGENNILADGITVVGKKPETARDRAYRLLPSDYESMLGNTRVENVSNQWSKPSHPYMDAFKDGSDMVGQVGEAIILGNSLNMGRSLWNLANLVRAGEWGTTAGIGAGGYLGHQATNYLTNLFSNGKYNSWQQTLGANG